jgi:hypothetical protein
MPIANNKAQAKEHLSGAAGEASRRPDKNRALSQRSGASEGSPWVARGIRAQALGMQGISLAGSRSKIETV